MESRMSKDKGSTLCFYVWVGWSRRPQKLFIMCKCNTFERHCLQVIKAVVLVVAIALFGIIVAMIVRQWQTTDWCELVLSPRMLRYALISLFSLITLYVAIITLHRSVSVEETKAIVALRNLFYQEGNLKVHQALNVDGYNFQSKIPFQCCQNSECKKDTSSLFATFEEQHCALNNYIGTLEVAFLMVEHGVITIEEFDNLFGYRLNSFFANTSASNYAEETRKYNPILFRAKKALDKFQNEKKMHN